MNTRRDFYVQRGKIAHNSVKMYKTSECRRIFKENKGREWRKQRVNRKPIGEQMLRG